MPQPSIQRIRGHCTLFGKTSSRPISQVSECLCSWNQSAAFQIVRPHKHAAPGQESTFTTHVISRQQEQGVSLLLPLANSPASCPAGFGAGLDWGHGGTMKPSWLVLVNDYNSLCRRVPGRHGTDRGCRAVGNSPRQQPGAEQCYFGGSQRP